MGSSCPDCTVGDRPRTRSPASWVRGYPLSFHIQYYFLRQQGSHLPGNMVDNRILPQTGTWYNNVAHWGRNTPALVRSVPFVCRNGSCTCEPVGRGSWDLRASSIFLTSSHDFSSSLPVSEVTWCFHSWAFLLVASQISQGIVLISSGESGILKLPCVLPPMCVTTLLPQSVRPHARGFWLGKSRVRPRNLSHRFLGDAAGEEPLH